jgi:hypothetical protein
MSHNRSLLEFSFKSRVNGIRPVSRTSRSGSALVPGTAGVKSAGVVIDGTAAGSQNGAMMHIDNRNINSDTVI